MEFFHDFKKLKIYKESRNSKILTPTDSTFLSVNGKKIDIQHEYILDKQSKTNKVQIENQKSNEVAKSQSEAAIPFYSYKKNQIAIKMENDIRNLLDNPLKLRKFKTQIEMIKEKLKRK